MKEDLKNQDYSEERFSRGIDTAATDTKSITNGTERKRVGKTSVRRKRKNVNIRKLSKKPGRNKKSSKSVVKTTQECIHEKVEEEDENEMVKNNNDLKDIEVESVPPEPKIYNMNNVNSLRNSSMINSGKNFSNRSMISAYPGKKESRRVTSIKKPVSDTVIVLESVYNDRPGTIFFQYPEYCGVVRDTSHTTEYTQSQFK